MPTKSNLLAWRSHADAAGAVSCTLPSSAIQAFYVASATRHEDDEVIRSRWSGEGLDFRWIFIGPEQQRAPTRLKAARSHPRAQVSMGIETANHSGAP